MNTRTARRIYITRKWEKQQEKRVSEDGRMARCLDYLQSKTFCVGIHNSCQRRNGKEGRSGEQCRRNEYAKTRRQNAEDEQHFFLSYFKELKCAVKQKNSQHFRDFFPFFPSPVFVSSAGSVLA